MQGNSIQGNGVVDKGILQGYFFELVLSFNLSSKGRLKKFQTAF